MTTEPTPTADGVLGTPPEPRRPVAVRVPSPRRVPWWRTLLVVIAAILAEVALAVVAGVWHLEAAVVATIAVSIPGCAWGQAWKSVREGAAETKTPPQSGP